MRVRDVVRRGLVAVTVGTVGAGAVLGCGNRSEPAPRGADGGPPVHGFPFTGGLPRQVGDYAGWVKLNRRPIPDDPAATHGGHKDVFINRTRAQLDGDRGFRVPLPPGTVVVKRGLRDGDRAAVVSVMAKVLDLDPQHGDWQFIEYARPAADAPYRVLAADEACWECHAKAIDTDWLFTTPQPGS